EEIVQEECKFTVKSSGIEITLKKTTSDRWASLEAPLRKEKIEPPQTDTWIPINAKPSASTLSASSSSSVSVSNEAADTWKSLSQGSKKQAITSAQTSGVAFDDLSDLNINYKGSRQTLFRDQSQDDEDDSADSFSFDNSQKPTAKVSPLNNQTSETGMIVPPGFAGLVNIGNTCFMNCIIQVLANTREFRDYFLDDRFKSDINEDNPLGMKGQLAATFGVLLRWLWSCKKHYWDPRRLKDLVSKKNPQFFGYAQHDAHEFLAFLLDGLHEDLNRIRKKPYTETIDSDGRPDKVVADEAWAQYKLRNDSVVVDLFQGQLKSKLVCPRCGKVSITFDPFLYMSVPLPKKKKVIPVHFIWKESYKKPIKIRIFEAYRGRILKFFHNGATLANVDPKDVIIACEVLSEEVAGEDVIEIPVMQRTLFPSEYPSHCACCHKPRMEGPPLRRCTKCYKVGYCDQTCQRKHWNLHKPVCSTLPDPIGCPFILSVPASRATYSYLVKHMEEFARFSVDIFQPPVKTSSSASSSIASEVTSSSVSASNIKPYPASPAVVGNGPFPAPASAPLPSSSSLLSGAAAGTSSGLGPSSSTNLSSCSLSHSCSSLNSLDSLSSASSTCTLTGDTSDTATGGGGGGGSSSGRSQDGGDGGAAVTEEGATAPETSVSPRYTSPCPPQLLPQTSYDGLPAMVGADASRSGSVDSGFESLGAKMGEKSVPMTSVLGVQASDMERDRAMTTFFIKPVSMEGTGLKGAERLEDKGDTPLELVSGRFLSMDWRNNERIPSYVLVQSKELESVEVDNLNNFVASGANKSSLYHCLELFTEPEVLNPEEAWYCPSCKKHVEASKQMSIWRLPHTLVIQLKRFSFQNFLMRSKIKKHIDFPTRGLDLSKFCVGLQPGDSAPIYDLYGVANHHGMLIGGHYTSYVRCSGLGNDVGASDEIGWRLCNDSRVTPVPCESSVVTSDAYLLFYRRRCPAVIGPTTTTISAVSNSATTRFFQDSAQSAASVSKTSQQLKKQQRIATPAPARGAEAVARGDFGDDEQETGEGAQGGLENDADSNYQDEPSESENSKPLKEGANICRHLLTGTFSSPVDSSSSHDTVNQTHRNTLEQTTPYKPPCSSNPLYRSYAREQMQCQDAAKSSQEPMEEVGEKKDEEKEYFDCDKELCEERDLDSTLDVDKDLAEDDDDDEVDEGGERALVIATDVELDYTDMEAVD
ncbi:ubiquitin carboxyl-terminal hydrolase 19, partial [Plakobranchus ocellatus]